MADKKYAKSDAKRREIQCYPPQKYLALVKGYAHENEISKSKAAIDIFRCFFEAMPEQERERYLAAYRQSLQQPPNNSPNRYA